jgi:T5SS/PEP-CTERM-associated repeat protein
MVIAAVASASSLQAQTIDWTGGGANDSYTNTSNWSGSNVPNTASESAQFNIPGAFDVTLGGGSVTTVSDLLVRQGDINFASSSGTIVFYYTDDDCVVTDASFSLSQAGGGGDVRLDVGDLLSITGGGSMAVELGSQLITERFSIATTAGDSSLSIDGVGSSLTVNTGGGFIGSGGGVGTLNFSNGSIGNDINGTLQLVLSGVAGSTGRMNVASNAIVTTDSIVVGNSSSTSVVQEATLTIDTGGTITMSGSAALTVGDDVNSNLDADVLIVGGGRLNTGTGAVLIQNLGEVTVGNPGSVFDVKGPLTVDNATLDINIAGGLVLAPSTTVVGSSNAQLEFSDDHMIDNDQFWTLQSGADYVGTSFAADLYVGNVTNGEIIVENAGSNIDLTAGGNLVVGLNGGTGTMTVRAGADVSADFLAIADDNDAGTTGVLNIESGGRVEANSLDLAESAGTTTTGTINIGGGGGFSVSSLVILDDGTVDVGDTSVTAGAGSINIVDNLGRVETGTGNFTIWTTGLVEINDGSFIANGPVIVDSGDLREINFGFFDYAAGATLTALDSGQINFDSSHTIDAGASVVIQSGADFTLGSTLRVGSGAGSDGSLLVEGIGSTLDVSGSTTVALSDATGVVTLRNGAQATLASVFLGSNSNTSATFNVESDADVTSNSITVNSNGDSGASSTINVTGIGSTWQASAVTLGNTSGNGTADINVLDGGSFTTTSLVNFYVNGVMTIDGGSVSLGSHTRVNGGKIDFVRGSLTSGSDWDINPGGLLGSVVDLQPGMHLATSGSGDDIILNPGGVVALNGGSIDVDDIVDNGGEFQFNRGTVRLRASNAFSLNSTSAFGQAFTLGPDQHVQLVSSGTVASEALLVLDGGTIVSEGFFSITGTTIVKSG